MLLLIAVALALAGNAWAGPKYKLLHAFDMGQHDGGGLWGSLVLDANGDLYGTAAGGGTYGYGIVFELTPQSSGHWTENILHNFNCKVEGCIPSAGLVFDPAGNLYGMTNTDVFELERGSDGWNLTVLHGGGGPVNLVLDEPGNIYGPMGVGEYGQGAISELVKDQNWTEDWLYSFCSKSNSKHDCLGGWDAFAGVTWGPGGSLYGTTKYGGNSPYNDPNCGKVGCGVVYELTPQSDGRWKETVLHSFPAYKDDGAVLSDSVILDKEGNLYGATSQGGSTNCGVIFELSPQGNSKWKETILHECGSNTLTFDAKGNLWGTAGGGKYGCGVVFELSPQNSGKWKYNVVHQFNGTDGALPASAVIFDKQGNLYGTTVLGGPGHSVGVVFEITP